MKSQKLERKVEKCVRYLKSLQHQLTATAWTKTQAPVAHRTITRIERLLRDRDELRDRMRSGVDPEAFIASFGGVVRHAFECAEGRS